MDGLTSLGSAAPALAEEAPNQTISFEQTAEHDAASEFLAALWTADTEGALSHVHMIAEKLPPEVSPKERFRHFPVLTVREAVARAFEISARGHDAYFACAAFKSFHPTKNKGNRTGENAVGAQCFWLDLDCGPEKSYANKSAAALELRGFCKSAGLPKPSFIVDSGNGLHCYWHFAEFIEKDRWLSLAKSLKGLTVTRGLKPDPSRTADIASVLRVPGTMNWKDRDNPKPVATASAGTAMDFDEFVAGLSRGNRAGVANLRLPQCR